MLNQIRSRHIIDTHITGIGFVENSDTFFRDSIKKTQFLGSESGVRLRNISWLDLLEGRWQFKI